MINFNRRLNVLEMITEPAPIEIAEWHTQTMQLTGYGLHDDIADEGCWVHSYCRYCTSNFCRSNLSNYLTSEYSNSIKGASVMAFKSGLESINDTCIYFGFDVYGTLDWRWQTPIVKGIEKLLFVPLTILVHFSWAFPTCSVLFSEILLEFTAKAHA